MAQVDLAFVILAAGKGTRMNSDLPKVLHKVAGKTMVAHAVNLSKHFSAQRIITVVAPDSKDVEAAAGTEIAVQAEQLGTADAVKATKSMLENFAGDVVILYGDMPLVTKETVAHLLEIRKDFDIGVVGFNATDPAKYGRLIAHGNIVEESIEFKDATPDQRNIKLCNACVYVIDAKLLFNLLEDVKANNQAGEFYLTDIIKIAGLRSLKTGLSLTAEENVLGINTKFELANAEAIMQNRLRRKFMEDGVKMIAPQTVFLAADVKIGRGVVIQPNVVIGENVVIGDNINIGPFAHIRPGSIINNGVKIGNFVEIKKSEIGENSSISHLSYIGDSTLGKNVNIGAGTITCNYNGFEKFNTVIGDNVFIGSNSALIAPVEIGDEAMVAAGSVITKNVPPKALGITRALQKNLADWVVRFKQSKKG